MIFSLIAMTPQNLLISKNLLITMISENLLIMISSLQLIASVTAEFTDNHDFQEFNFQLDQNLLINNHDFQEFINNHA